MPIESSIAETAAREVFTLKSEKLESFALHNMEVISQFWELQEEAREALEDYNRISNNVSVLK